MKINPNINLSMKFDAILSQSLKQYESETTYYEPEIVKQNLEELKEKLTDDFEEIFKSQNEKQTQDFL